MSEDLNPKKITVVDPTSKKRKIESDSEEDGEEASDIRMSSNGHYYDHAKWMREKKAKGEWMERGEWIEKMKKEGKWKSTEERLVEKKRRVEEQEETIVSKSLIDRIVIFDTETTGLGDRDEIVEISLIEMVDGIKTGRGLQFYVRPEKKVPKKAIKIHNLTNEFLQDKPRFKDVAMMVMAFIGSSSLMAHNAKFDRIKLNYELEKCGYDTYPRNRFIDTATMARFIWPGEDNSQDGLCKRFKIDNYNRRTTGIHSAKEDTAHLYLIYRELALRLEEKGYDYSYFRLD
jgi:DNA polymerase-3 subunit epsilon